MNLAHWFLPTQGRLSAQDRRLLVRVASFIPARWRIALLHPAREDVQAERRFEAITPRRWDLRFRSAQRYDLLVAGRVPGFVPESAAFRAALGSCQALLTLDAPASTTLGVQPLAQLAVEGGTLRVYRGELTDPLLRVDDYPTGVRPILEDLSSLHDVLSQIDAAGLSFHLGVVPALLDDRMTAYLRGLSQLVVSMHGFEHGYAKHSEILIRAGDPFNQRGTVSGFDEFSGRDYAEILPKIQRGRQLLEARLGQVPLSYIPPCNEGNRSTGRALLATGFEYVLSEKPIPGSELPLIRSDFYDRSSAFSPEMRPNVASLHATWEADMLRAGDTQSLPRFLSALVEQRAAARSQVEHVAGELQRSLSRG
ncbi:MAG TPA: hypothetical protein VER11_33695 [Polyangiaceae bacterium]|nr:hypothetical protein [Polyangiaceae bacterium]